MSPEEASIVRSRSHADTGRPIENNDVTHITMMDRAQTATSSAAATAAATNMTNMTNNATAIPTEIAPEGSAISAMTTDSPHNSHTPKDVTITDIRDQGLRVLLRSRLPLCYFLRFLLEEHSCENLICYLEIEHYESQHYETTLEQQTAALQILDVYLSPRSPFEVNVTERAHAQCQAAIASDDPEKIASCFVNVKPAVFQLLLDAYMRFARSEWWRSMVGQLDGKHFYSVEDRNATVGHLIGYLDRLHKHDLVHAPDRAALFRELIADFCRTVVGVEIIITSSPPVTNRNATRLHGQGQGVPSGYPSNEALDAAAQAAMRKAKSNPLMKLKNNFRKWG